MALDPQKVLAGLARHARAYLGADHAARLVEKYQRGMQEHSADGDCLGTAGYCPLAQAVPECDDLYSYVFQAGMMERLTPEDEGRCYHLIAELMEILTGEETPVLAVSRIEI